MHECLMVDFGSTYTKVTAFDLDENRLLGRAQSPTTIGSDVRVGLEKELDNLKASCGVDGRAIAERYACSSAAGGLRMTAIGLVPALTLEAARRAALGAGAKVVAAYGYEIYDEIVREIEELRCDIIMLCGGTDGGNKAVILHNAKMLADSQVDCPILVCGNKVVTGQVKNLLEEAGKRVYTAPNVLPEVNRVDAAPAQQMIREIFIEHIVRAKGLDRAADFFCCPITDAYCVAARGGAAGGRHGECPRHRQPADSRGRRRDDEHTFRRGHTPRDVADHNARPAGRARDAHRGGGPRHPLQCAHDF